MEEYRICSRCVSDTTIPGIKFDEQGVCQFCYIHDEMDRAAPQGERGQQMLDELISKIKASGKGKRYDVVVGLSGGRDSTYMLYSAVKWGLRPLAVHFDNGWNSEIAVRNIKNATNKLDVDLYTHVADWEEFKDLQIAFLKASVSDAEIPTDVAIYGALFKAAAQEGIKHIFFGHSFRTEGLMPIGWTYMDGHYVNSVHKQFGKRGKLKTVPNFTAFDLLYYNFVRGISILTPLIYTEYNQEAVGEVMERELDWQYYGGHHHESYYTKFFQSYLLPKKFNIDKRKLENSALVRDGQMSRADAIQEIQGTPYPYDEELVSYTIKKLGLSPTEFEEIMEDPIKTFHDYPTYYPLMQAFRVPIKLATDLGVLPKLLYYKYLA